MSLRAVAIRLLLGALGLLVAAACSSVPATLPSAVPAALQSGEQPAGKLVYVRAGDLWVWQAGEPRQLTSGGTWRQPTLSPDGAEIAYVLRQQNFSDLFAMSVDGSTSRRLTNGEANVVGQNDWTFRPAWSRDGSRIAYISDANSYFPVVWVMNGDGSGKRQVMTPAMNLDAADAISWAPDGRRLAVTAMGREATQIHLIDLVEGIAERLTAHPQGALDPAWSPDGALIAYIAREGGRTELRLKRPDGSGDAKFDKLAYVRSPTWSPDGRSLAVLSAQGGSFDVWIGSVEVDGDSPRFGEFRQLTRDGGIDAASGLSWAR
jgi:Tol biopolymer transport system component